MMSLFGPIDTKKGIRIFLFSLFCLFLVPCFFTNSANAGLENSKNEFLVKLYNKNYLNKFLKEFESHISKVEEFKYISWAKIILKEESNKSDLLRKIEKSNYVESIQPNYRVSLIDNYKVTDEDFLNVIQNRSDLFTGGAGQNSVLKAIVDNPSIPSNTSPGGSGPDPLFNKQWGMQNIGVQEAWKVTKGDPNIIVAVIDTGVDYTHEDLLPNIWRNSGENGVDSQGRDKATNGFDDDQNGYIDDVIGWDFVSNDNKPFDLTTTVWEMVMGGGNPGHGTHCAGNVAAKGENGKGISGIAPNVKIMPLRFLSEKGEGTTAEAIKAVEYAVRMGARVLSNSWGSEGEDPSENESNQALKDVIKLAEDKGVLFIAAAGNGHQGVGYDNDSDSKPGYPASYRNENIISVAAIGSNDELGAFSNWGKVSVDLAAPGVHVFSTVPGNNYNDVVLDLMGMTVYWDGTSMATPHVAGAAALYWSKNSNKNWREVKTAILNSSKKVSSLSNKILTGGKLDVKNLILNY